MGAIESISSKIGCVPQTLHAWVRQHEIDDGRACGRLDDRSPAIGSWSARARTAQGQRDPEASAFFAQAELDRRIKK